MGSGNCRKSGMPSASGFLCRGRRRKDISILRSSCYTAAQSCGCYIYVSSDSADRLPMPGFNQLLRMAGKAKLGEWVSRFTGQIEGRCLAIQALASDGAVLFADERFRHLLPGVAESPGGITSAWSKIDGPRPEDAYSDGPKGWTFVRFTNTPGRLAGDHFIDAARLAEIAGRDVDLDGQYFYCGEVEVPDWGRIIWLFEATEDIRIKRDRHRNEVAGKAVLDTIFAMPSETKPKSFAHRSMPKDGVIGGDFVLAQSFPDATAPKRACIVIGDGAGHGVEAGLQAAQIGTTLRRLFSPQEIERKNSWWHAKQPAEALLDALDAELTASTRQALAEVGEKPATRIGRLGALDACVIVVDYDDDRIFVAGTNIPVWMVKINKKAPPEVKRVVGYDSERAGKHVGVLSLDGDEGLDDDGRDGPYSVDVFKRKLPEKRKLRFVVATDGFVAQRAPGATNAEREPYGSARVERMIMNTNREARIVALDAMASDWLRYRNGADQDDDALLAIVDIN